MKPIQDFTNQDVEDFFMALTAPPETHNYYYKGGELYKMKNLFNKTQIVREMAIADGVHIAFACYKHDGDTGTTFFNIKENDTRPIFNISDYDKTTAEDLYRNFLIGIKAYDLKLELNKILQDINAIEISELCPIMIKIQLEVLNEIRNKLNRKISTLKKANLKQNICQYCGEGWESYDHDMDCCNECYQEKQRQNK